MFEETVSLLTVLRQQVPKNPEMYKPGACASTRAPSVSEIKLGRDRQLRAIILIPNIVDAVYKQFFAKIQGIHLDPKSAFDRQVHQDCRGPRLAANNLAICSEKDTYTYISNNLSQPALVAVRLLECGGDRERLWERCNKLDNSLPTLSSAPGSGGDSSLGKGSITDALLWVPKAGRIGKVPLNPEDLLDDYTAVMGQEHKTQAALPTKDIEMLSFPQTDNAMLPFIWPDRNRKPLSDSRSKIYLQVRLGLTHALNCLFYLRC